MSTLKKHPPLLPKKEPAIGKEQEKNRDRIHEAHGLLYVVGLDFAPRLSHIGAKMRLSMRQAPRPSKRRKKAAITKRKPAIRAGM